MPLTTTVAQKCMSLFGYVFLILAFLKHSVLFSTSVCGRDSYFCSNRCPMELLLICINAFNTSPAELQAGLIYMLTSKVTKLPFLAPFVKAYK